MYTYELWLYHFISNTLFLNLLSFFIDHMIAVSTFSRGWFFSSFKFHSMNRVSLLCFCKFSILSLKKSYTFLYSSYRTKYSLLWTWVYDLSWYWMVDVFPCTFLFKFSSLYFLTVIIAFPCNVLFTSCHLFSSLPVINTMQDQAWSWR